MHAQHKPGVFSLRPFEIRFTASTPSAPATFFCRKERTSRIGFCPRFAVTVSHSQPIRLTRRSRAFGHRSTPAPTRHVATSIRRTFASRLPFAAFARPPFAAPRRPCAMHAIACRLPADSATPARRHAASAPRPVRPKSHPAQRQDEVGGLGIGVESPPRGRDARSAGGVLAPRTLIFAYPPLPLVPRPGESSSNKTARSSLSVAKMITRRQAHQAHL